MINEKEYTLDRYYRLKDLRIMLQPEGNMYGTVVQSNDYFPFGMVYPDNYD
jgi:hypothetical protein